MNGVWLQTFITAIASVAASSGLWAYVTSRRSRKSATTQLLLGLAHDRIIYLGMSYVDRGWISKDEYDDLFRYLYIPYSKFGGNGIADRVIEEVKSLPIRRSRRFKDLKDAIRESHEGVV